MSFLLFSLPVETSVALFLIGLALLVLAGWRQRATTRRERDILEITQHLPGVIYRSRLRPDGSSHLEFITRGDHLIGWDPRKLTLPTFDPIQVVHEDDRERVRAIVEELARDQKPRHFELRCLRPTGEPVWVRTGVSVIRSKRGELYMMGFAENVEESHRTREALEQTRSRMTMAMAAAHMGIWDWDVKRDLVHWSDEVYSILGVPIGSFGGNYAAYLDLVHPEDRALVTSSIHRALHGDQATFAHENRMRHGDGHEVWVTSSGKVIRSPEGKPVRVVGAVVDITARRVAEIALAEQRERLNFVLAGSQDGFWDWNLETGHVTFSDRWATMLGYEPEDVEPVASSWEVLVHPADRQHVWEALNAHLNGQSETYEVEHRLRTRQGAYKWILARGMVVARDAEEQPLRISGTHTDIDERKRAQEALASSEKRLLEAERIGSFGSLELDVFEGHLLVSPGFLKILDAAETGQTTSREWFLERIHPGDRERIGEHFHHPPAERRIRLDFRLHTSRGERRHVQLEAEFDPTNNMLRGTIQDVTAGKLAEKQLTRYRDHLERLVRKRTTELEKTQAELIRQERLATLGQLTGTVGHELRNPLGSIRSTFFAVQGRLQREVPELEEAIHRIERNILRCDRIIEELLDYTRNPRLELEPRNLDTWLDEALIELEIPERIALVRERGARVPVRFDAERMRRSIVNLVTNAVQAMSDAGDAGRLTVTTKQDDERTSIEIRDTGHGFSEENPQRALEPLYSTRSFGVGLGLPIVERIVQEHGGTLALRNHPGGGAIVRIELPRNPPSNQP